MVANFPNISRISNVKPDVETISQRANLIVVLGMHRSGTSALAGLVHAAGAAVSAHLLEDQPDINEKGFWEDRVIVALNNRVLAAQQLHWYNWQGPDKDRLLAAAQGDMGAEAQAYLRQQYPNHRLSVCKDPRFCRTLPFWKHCFARAGLSPLYLLCLRHPAEVAASLERRDGLSLDYGTLLWMTYTVDALGALVGEPLLRFDYTEILESPTEVVKSVAELAGAGQELTTRPDEVEAAVNANMRHHTEHGAGLLLPDLQTEGEALYQTLRWGPRETWDRKVAKAASYVGDNDTTWSSIAEFALRSMRRSGELVKIGAKHQMALDTIAERDAQLKDEVAWREHLELELGKHKAQLKDEVAWREHLELELGKHKAQLKDEVAWREHLEDELTKCRVLLSELNEGLLAVPVRLRRRFRIWLKAISGN